MFSVGPLQKWEDVQETKPKMQEEERLAIKAFIYWYEIFVSLFHYILFSC